MEYTINVGNHTRSTYKGTPEEIATLIYYEENGIDIDGEFLSKKGILYDRHDAIEFINDNLPDALEDGKFTIGRILRLNEDYMRSKERLR